MGRNMQTTLRGRARTRPMDSYDRLPCELRRWLSAAALPWSAQSALRLWARLARETGGDLAAMLHRLDLAEARLLSRDARQIWGQAHPAAAASRRDPARRDQG